MAHIVGVTLLFAATALLAGFWDPCLQLVFRSKVGKGHIPPDILLCGPDSKLIEMGVVDGSETNGIAFENHSLQRPLKAIRRHKESVAVRASIEWPHSCDEVA